jgi:RNA polymerase sigma factor (sigma-70 family)
MRDDPAVVALVVRANDGDQDAWNEIVERYAPLVVAICARYRLSEPAALPGWLKTTIVRECLRVVTAARRSERLGSRLEDEDQFVDDTKIEEDYLMAERNAALRAAFAELPPHCQRMLGMLLSDPPHSYNEISAVLGIPVGSIGPQRARCLERLRKSRALMAFDEFTVNTPGGEPRA